MNEARTSFIRKFRIALLLLLLLGASLSYLRVQGQSGADFAVSVHPSSSIAFPNQGVSYNITLSSVDNFADQVTLTLAIPAGVARTFAFQPNPVTLTANQTVYSNLTIQTAQNAMQGTYNLALNATSSSQTHSSYFLLSIVTKSNVRSFSLPLLIPILAILVSGAILLGKRPNRIRIR